MTDILTANAIELILSVIFQAKMQVQLWVKYQDTTYNVLYLIVNEIPTDLTWITLYIYQVFTRHASAFSLWFVNSLEPSFIWQKKDFQYFHWPSKI